MRLRGRILSVLLRRRLQHFPESLQLFELYVSHLRVQDEVNNMYLFLETATFGNVQCLIQIKFQLNTEAISEIQTTLHYRLKLGQSPPPSTASW